MTINREQLSALEGFKLHTWNVFHNKTPNMFKFWAKELDDKKFLIICKIKLQTGLLQEKMVLNH